MDAAVFIVATFSEQKLRISFHQLIQLCNLKCL